MRRNLIIAILSASALGFLLAAAFTMWGDRLPVSDTKPVPVVRAGEPSVALRLEIRDPGIVSVTTNDLRTANLPFDTISNENLALTLDGKTIPFYTDSDATTLFFYVPPFTDTIESPPVYWLTNGIGTPMGTHNGAPTDVGISVGTRFVKWEENKTFVPTAAQGDVWLSNLLPASQKKEIALELPQATGGEGNIEITLWSNNQSPEEPDHHLNLMLNDREVLDELWDGIRSVYFEQMIPAEILQPGTNNLVVWAPGDTGAVGEALYLDNIMVQYEANLVMGGDQIHFTSGEDNITVLNAEESSLVFSIKENDSAEIVLQTLSTSEGLSFNGTGLGSEYIITTPESAGKPIISAVPDWGNTLRAENRGADYIAILPAIEDFETALEPLLVYRAGQGLNVQSIQLQQIYDEFGNGQPSNEAIRDFLAYAVRQWEPAPRFALLVGDATYDPNKFIFNANNAKEDENGNNATQETPLENLLPTQLVYTEYAGYVASDTWFSIFDEESVTPEIAIGRFPVQTVGQLRIIVNKTIEYESRKDEEWYDDVLLVSDDEDQFTNSSNRLAETLTLAGFSANKLQMTRNEEIHDDIIDAINSGVSIINYIGHGSVHVWGDERVFQVDDMPLLKNENKLPIFTTFTCLNGYFNHPADTSLAEALLWAETGGVAAAIAPSGRSLPSQQDPLADAFYNYLLNTEGATIGEALQAAKIANADDPFFSEVIHTFNLLGDPALNFRLPTETK